MLNRDPIIDRASPQPIAKYLAAGDWLLACEKTVYRCAAFLRQHPGFTIIVALPTLLAALYFGLIAANIYVSSAEFVVKSANENASTSSLGTILASTGIATSTNDAYSVQSYLTSRDALTELEKNPGVRDIYHRPEADFVAEFPNLLFRNSFENLYWYYTTWWTDVSFDSTSNVTTLDVYAFRPEDAQALGRRLLALGEREVNDLNDRARNDALRGARREVDILQKRSLVIANKITDFRNTELLLDPNQTSAQSITLLTTLESELVSARAALAQLQRSAASSPQVPSLRARIAALDAQVTSEEVKDAGPGNSLAPKMANYGQMLLQQQFLQEMLQAAVTSLEAAEATVQQQQLYLEPIAQPNRPDSAQYPRRLLNTLIVLITSMLIYWIGRMLVAAAREHLAG